MLALSAVLGALTLGGCSFAGGDAELEALATVDVVDQVDVVTVGAEPRAVLRYRFDSDPNYKVTSTDTVRVLQQVLPGDEVDPSISTEVDATVATETQIMIEQFGRSPGGDGALFALQSEIVDARVDEATSSEVASALSSLQGHIGQRAVRLVDERGLRYGHDADNRTESAVATMTAALGSSLDSPTSARVDLIALPAEAVGVGATWLVGPSAFNVGDYDQRNAVSVELVDLELDDDGRPLRLAVELAMPSAPRAESGLERSVQALEGTLAVDLRYPAHTAAVSSSATYLASAEAVLGGFELSAWDMPDGLIEQIVEVDSVIETAVDVSE